MWQPSFLALESPARVGQEHITLLAKAFETHHDPKLFLREEVDVNWLRADDHAVICRNPDCSA